MNQANGTDERILEQLRDRGRQLRTAAVATGAGPEITRLLRYR